MKKSSENSAVLKLKLLAVICAVLTIAGAANAQQVQHYNSPLYSPKAYDPSSSEPNGLPKALDNVGIEQKLNAQIPIETEFKNEDGKTVKLGEYFKSGRPVIVALVYYECPMLCSEVLNGLTGGLKGISFDAGKEFDVVAISFDARENDKPNLAKNKKENYVNRYERTGTENGWHFLTGTQSSIDAVTQAVGFNYKYDEATNQFAHAGGFLIATPEGRVSKYYYGIEYAPKDIKLGIQESAQNKIGDPVDKLLLYCYHYDPSKGKYGLAILNVIRIGGVVTLLGLGAMFFVFRRFNKNGKSEAF